MIVVSDTSPICYLLLIEEIDLLPQLYKQAYIPQAVQQELVNNRSPAVVKAWIEHPPEWLVICSVEVLGTNLSYLDPGERAVIALAEEQGADLVIVDDGLGRRSARTRQLKVTGLLGILDAAAQQSLVYFQSRFLVYNKQHLEFRDRCLRHCCNSINETIRGQLTEITKQVYLPTHKFSL